MRIEITIDEDTFARAKELAGTNDVSAVINLALKSFVAREAGRRLARMGGSEPAAKMPRRRRF